MNFVDHLLNEILAESPQPLVAPPTTKPMAPPRPSKPLPGTRPTIPTRRPGVAPRPKARDDDEDSRDARTYPKATDVAHFTPQTGTQMGIGSAGYAVEAEGGAISVPPPPASEEPEGGPQPQALPTLCDQIRPGDRITILTPQGQKVSGRAVMRNRQHGCWVLNMGGPHGRPGIADEENIVQVRRGGKTIYGKI